jgi:hypothetical protein
MLALKYQLPCQKYASDDFANHPKNQELFFHKQKFDLLHLSTKEMLKKEYKKNNQKNITRPLHSQFHEKMYFVDIFFCLFFNFRDSKPTRTQTQNRER